MRFLRGSNVWKSAEVMIMGLRVCPAAIVAAPVEEVWSLLANPAKYGEWADARVERVVPEGPVTPGQRIYPTSKAFGRTWSVVFNS